MQKQTKILSDEHQVILKVVDALEKQCGILREKKEINRDFLKKSIDFIRNYADKFHHAKEENILFVEFCKKAHLAHCNPVEQMLHEHKMGREYVADMERAMNENNSEAVVENGLKYAELLKEHIMKEDTILYPMMDEVFDEKIQKLISEQAEEAEKKFGECYSDKYLALADSLSKL